MCTKQTNADNSVMFILIIVGGSGTPTTTPPGNIDMSPPTPTGPHVSSTYQGERYTMTMTGSVPECCCENGQYGQYCP